LTPEVEWSYPNIFLATYPRSGSNYFAQYFNQLTGEIIAKAHDLTHYKRGDIVTIVRSPIECMASRSAMICHTSNFKNLSSISQVADESFNEYINFYENIAPKASILIDYNLFVSKPQEEMSKFLNKLNIPHKTEEYNQVLKDRENEYIVSSKETDMYSMMVEHYKQTDTSYLFDLYTKALSLCH
jgi:hypothetical protein